jgi:hypothetical protein
VVLGVVPKPVLESMAPAVEQQVLVRVFAAPAWPGHRLPENLAGSDRGETAFSPASPEREELVKGTEAGGGQALSGGRMSEAWRSSRGVP